MWSVIAGVSYSVATAAYLLLFALLLVRWRGGRHGALLVLACGMTVVWAGAIVLAAMRNLPISMQIGLLEILRNASWSAFLLGVLSPSYRTHLILGLRLSKQVVLFAGLYLLLALTYIVAYVDDGVVGDLAGMISGSPGFIIMAVMGMLLIEQLFRSTAEKSRWAIKFACLGIGGIFAYDFYLYVDALLFRQVNAEIWAARGGAIAFAVPLIAVSAARNPDWSVGISVSRRILFHSVTLIGSAIYLLTVAAAGYYLRFFGGEWGSVLQATFLFGAFFLLVAVLFSGTFRSWLRVFISKHFYNYGYDYREEWLKFTRMLSVEGPQLGERAIEAIAQLVESSKGVLYTRNETDQYVASAKWNTSFANEPEPADSALCNFLRNRQWIIDIQEFDAQPEKYEGLSLPGWLRQFPQAWLVVPLMQNTTLLGFVVLSEARSKVTLNWEVLDLLKIVGIQTAGYLAKQESADALAVARQFETFNRMSTFVVHDLKNLVAQLALLVANAEKHKGSEEFQRDMVETIEHAVVKMRVLLQKFNRESTTEKSGPVVLDKILQQAIASKGAAEPKPQLDLHRSGLAVSANAVRLERVIGHLIQNAVEATPRGGQVTVRLTEQDGSAVIEVIDTGSGMSEQFIQARLFKPFESTKAAGMGIGVFETREYVHQIGGQLDVDSEPSKGTTFRVSLPLYVDEQDCVSNAA
ncbi:XrtA/PEP-CTERM system histidine kinase PrsK [Noviherbaspirillum denitrificans]|uniref:histidine kinase n=1 Tax=Noviherbaspirillum denitrificans TaxID=1968433 RepID=A0A254TCN9_9BURK|nr:XrtA/PEP-CTERM system histidine kinase PrsK [Noviherbaspirillum denitrificans]OWW20400.1 histidine kinase [Noviherbaspirillum denitrificans]